ncbi:hypothetical protein CY34DRAFT_19653 [Suillus luteus UH-Slu-Lm8-n1]|uniref:C2H2-type domain-containing protein n=1 Tax=Suillus luteus UH-Slu-Lm8-n1 TaxID=930992 RepID=A0A0C9Z2L5_9AGAM|nr:hypothetical protein CY34DRAFT_19653 [Suillus luteus UH-Slu-Lm8-n1]
MSYSNLHPSASNFHDGDKALLTTAGPVEACESDTTTSAFPSSHDLSHVLVDKLMVKVHLCTLAGATAAQKSQLTLHLRSQMHSKMCS